MIDAHHHLWKYNPGEYGWMDDSMTILKRDYLPGELEQEVRRTGIKGTVAVQARQCMEETRWLLELADKHSFIKGVVGWFDLCSPGLENALEEFVPHPRLVGARHVIHDEPDDDYMLRHDFIQGIGQLERHNLVYDLLLFPRHLSRAEKLVGMFPRLRFVLDHLGKPPIKSGKLEPWKSGIQNLAQHPNVWCKLSGMVTEADHKQWDYKELRPYMEVVLNAFGTERIMMGSDWPVCRLAGEYSQVVEVVTNFIQSMDSKAQVNILYQNAVDCYQINLKSNGETKV